MTFINKINSLVTYNEVLSDVDMGKIYDLLFDKKIEGTKVTYIPRRNARERVIRNLNSITFNNRLVDVTKISEDKFDQLMTNNDRFFGSVHAYIKRFETKDDDEAPTNSHSKTRDVLLNILARNTIIEFNKQKIDLKGMSNEEFNNLIKNVNFLKIIRKHFKEKSYFRNTVINSQSNDYSDRKGFDSKEWLRNRWKIQSFFRELKKIYRVKNNANRLVINLNDQKIDSNLNNLNDMFDTKRLSRILFSNGYNRILYEIGVCYDNLRKMYSIATAISKIIEKIKDTNKEDYEFLSKIDLTKIYDNNYKIIFSLEPKMIASQSTNVDWYSCMNLASTYNQKKHVGSSFRDGGNCVVYITKTGDSAIKRPLARLLVKPFSVDGLETKRNMLHEEIKKIVERKMKKRFGENIDLNDEKNALLAKTMFDKYRKSTEGTLVNYHLEKMYTSKNMDAIYVPQDDYKEGTVLNLFEKKVQRVVDKINNNNIKKLVVLSTKNNKIFPGEKTINYSLSVNNYADPVSRTSVNISLQKTINKIRNGEKFKDEEVNALVNHLVSNAGDDEFKQITTLLFQKKYFDIIKKISNSKKLIADLRQIKKLSDFVDVLNKNIPEIKKETELQKGESLLVDDDGNPLFKDIIKPEKEKYFSNDDIEYFRDLVKKHENRKKDIEDKAQPFLSKQMSSLKIEELETIKVTDKQIIDAASKKFNLIEAKEVILPFITKGNEKISIESNSVVYSVSEGQNSPNNLQKIDKNNFKINIKPDDDQKHQNGFVYKFNQNKDDGKFIINDFINIIKDKSEDSKDLSHMIGDVKINMMPIDYKNFKRKDIYVNIKPLNLIKNSKNKMTINFEDNFNRDLIYDFEHCSLDFKNLKTNESFRFLLNDTVEIKKFPSKYFVNIDSDDDLRGSIDQIPIFFGIIKKNIINTFTPKKGKDEKMDKNRNFFINQYFKNEKLISLKDINTDLNKGSLVKESKNSLPQEIYFLFDATFLDKPIDLSQLDNIETFCADFNIKIHYLFREKNKYVKKDIKSANKDEIRLLQLRARKESSRRTAYFMDYSDPDKKMIYCHTFLDEIEFSKNDEQKPLPLDGEDIYKYVFDSTHLPGFEINNSFKGEINIFDLQRGDFDFDIIGYPSLDIKLLNNNTDKSPKKSKKIQIKENLDNNKEESSGYRKFLIQNYEIEILENKATNVELTLDKTKIKKMTSGKTEKIKNLILINDSSIDSFDGEINVNFLQIKNSNIFDMKKINFSKFEIELDNYKKVNSFDYIPWGLFFKDTNNKIIIKDVSDLSNFPIFIYQTKKEEIKKYLKNDHNIVYINTNNNKNFLDSKIERIIFNNFINKLNLDMNDNKNHEIIKTIFSDMNAYSHNFSSYLKDFDIKIESNKKDKITSNDSFVRYFNKINSKNYFD